MGSARWKLVSLWLSQTARVTADNALRFFVCLDYASQGETQKNSAWYVVTAIFSMPAILLAPLNGALCNTLPKRQVLIASALFGVVVMAVFGLWQDHWLWCWAFIALGSAIYSPTRFQTLTAFLTASFHFLVIRKLFTRSSTKVTRLRTAIAHHDATGTAPSAELSASDAAG